MTQDRLVAIFEQQASHMDVYAQIEEDNGLLQTPDVPVDLNDRFGQARLKDFAWRITEELGEALDSVYYKDEYHEELSDVLHFLAEFTILAGYNPESLVVMVHPVEENHNDLLDFLYHEAEQDIMNDFYGRNEYQSAHLLTAQVIKSLSLACNTLKNKAWKRSARATDILGFETHLIKMWRSFILLCRASGIDAQRLHDLYFRKSEINKQRQESGY